MVKPVFDVNASEEPGHVYHATNRDGFYGIQDTGKIATHHPWRGTDQDAWPDRSTKRRAYFGDSPGTVEPFRPEEGPHVLLRVKHQPEMRVERGTGDIYSEKPVSAHHADFWGDDKAWHPVMSDDAD